MAWFYLVLGLILLVVGGEMLVRGASGLAERNGISRLLIGLTIVSIGTSAPEFAISAYASFLGKTDIALGNVVGSNIFNILCALGLAAIISPLKVKSKTTSIDLPVMLIISFIVFGMAISGTISRLHGVLLLLSFISFNIFLIYHEKHHRREDTRLSSFVKKNDSSQFLLFLIFIGTVLLPIGSHILVKGAISIAQQLHISELVISLTIIAAGTSLPEAVTAIIAARHRESDLVIGNVIGSNIANLSGVLGLGAITAPHGISVAAPVLLFDLPIMLAASIACIPIFYTQDSVSRFEGMLLFLYYLLFITYVVLNATSHPSLPLLHDALLYFCLPLTLIMCGFYAIAEFKKRCHKINRL